MINLLIRHTIADLAIELLASNVYINFLPTKIKRTFPDGFYSRALIKANESSDTYIIRDCIFQNLIFAHIIKVSFNNTGNQIFSSIFFTTAENVIEAK
jgi:hypothetical protein